VVSKSHCRACGAVGQRRDIAGADFLVCERYRFPGGLRLGGLFCRQCAELAHRTWRGCVLSISGRCPPRRALKRWLRDSDGRKWRQLGLP
jgi:hypothetical protein